MEHRPVVGNDASAVEKLPVKRCPHTMVEVSIYRQVIDQVQVTRRGDRPPIASGSIRKNMAPGTKPIGIIVRCSTCDYVAQYTEDIPRWVKTILDGEDRKNRIIRILDGS